MSKPNTYKPGEIVRHSGQVEIIHDGRKTGVERTVVKGEPFPPTPHPGDRFIVVDPTKHKTKK